MNEHFEQMETNHPLYYLVNTESAEEKVLIDALRQHLKREPSIEDFKKCRLIYIHDITRKFDFAYDGLVLGHAESKFEYDEVTRTAKYIVTFYPKKVI